MAFAKLALPVGLCLISLGHLAPRAEAVGVQAAHQLRHREQSAVRISGPTAPPAAAESPHRAKLPVVAMLQTVHVAPQAPAASASVPAPAAAHIAHPYEKNDDEEEALLSSMGSLLQSEEEVMDPQSQKAKLQREVVSLIWLEQVLTENLKTMNSENFMAKLVATRAALRQDTSPATAAMLERMRSEVQQFNAPFFRKVVEEELVKIRREQKVLLAKIAEIDSRKEPPTSDLVPQSTTDEPPVHIARKHANPSQWTTAGVLGVSLMSLGALVALIALGIKCASGRSGNASPPRAAAAAQ